MKKFLVVAIIMLSSLAFAGDLTIASGMSQSNFKKLVEELSFIVTPTPNSPAEPLGITGFDLSFETFAVDINDDTEYWTSAWEDNDVDDMVGGYRVRLQKGLPMGIDVSGAISKGLNLDFTAITGEVKYAILEGTVATPAISVKGSYTRVLTIEDVELDTALAGIYISKGILMLTPYAGAEAVYGMASDESGNGLDDENTLDYRPMLGIQICPFPLLVVNVEATFGDTPQYGLKAALRF